MKLATGSEPNWCDNWLPRSYSSLRPAPGQCRRTLIRRTIRLIYLQRVVEPVLLCRVPTAEAGARGAVTPNF